MQKIFSKVLPIAVVLLGLGVIAHSSIPAVQADTVGPVASVKAVVVPAPAVTLLASTSLDQPKDVKNAPTMPTHVFDSEFNAAIADKWSLQSPSLVAGLAGYINKKNGRVYLSPDFYGPPASMGGWNKFTPPHGTTSWSDLIDLYSNPNPAAG